MLAVTWTWAVSDAENLPDLSGMGCYDLLGAIHGSLLASANSWDLWWREFSATTRFWEAALEARGARAEAGLGVSARARGGEAAVAAITTRSLRAAFDVGRKPGTGIEDVFSTSFGAAGG